MDISIVVPVFNVEKCLVRCLDSIFNQQFSGTFEVIAVDDGSTDNSLQLLYNYQMNEKRLKVIVHEKNKKLSVARATGMKAAAGEYIMHVDSDDCLLPEAFERLHAKIIETKADVVVFNLLKKDSKGEYTFAKGIKKEFILTDKAKVQSLFFETCVNKIVRRVLTENMISGEVSVNYREDLLYSFEILLRAKKICFIPESYYVYYTNNESLTQTVTPAQSTQNNSVILNQIQKIIDANKSSLKLTRNLLNYFENGIYLDLAKTHFWHKGDKINYILLAREFSKYPIVSRSRIRRLKLSIKSGFICLLEIAYRYKLKQIRGIIRGSFSKRNLVRQ